MTTIRIAPQTHQKLKTIVLKKGGRLTDFLTQIADLLLSAQLTPQEIQTKLEEHHSLEKMLDELLAQITQLLVKQERNFRQALKHELATLKRLPQMAPDPEQELVSLVDLYERLHHLEWLARENSLALEKQYQLLSQAWGCTSV